LKLYDILDLHSDKILNVKIEFCNNLNSIISTVDENDEQNEEILEKYD